MKTPEQRLEEFQRDLKKLLKKHGIEIHSPEEYYGRFLLYSPAQYVGGVYQTSARVVCGPVANHKSLHIHSEEDL